MIKVLLLTSSYPSSTDIINKSFMTDLAGSLSKKSIEIFVVCPHQPSLPLYEKQKKVKIIRFPYWFTKSGQKLGVKGGIVASIYQSPVAVIQLIPFCICEFIIAWKIIKKEKIDIIHSHWIVPQGLIGAIIRLITGIPHITSIHGTDIHLVHSHKLAYPLIRLITKYSNNITTNSSHTCRLLQDIVRQNMTKNRVIPMGIFPEEFSPKPHFINKGQKKILFIGRLIAWKGTSILIRSLKKIYVKDPSILLFIVGDGPEKQSLENLANDLDITENVCFLGNLPRKELQLCYKNASVFVLPSIIHKNQTEGLGVVLLEAMASGVPVIGSNIGGIPDIIKDGVNGLLVPPGDPDALAAAIINILDNSDLSERFRDAGLKTINEKFSWDKISDQFIEIYQKLFKKP